MWQVGDMARQLRFEYEGAFQEKGRSRRTCCTGTGRVFIDDGEGVGVFGGAGSRVPWGDRFLCDEDCSREAAVGRG